MACARRRSGIIVMMTTRSDQPALRACALLLVASCTSGSARHYGHSDAPIGAPSSDEPSSDERSTQKSAARERAHAEDQSGTFVLDVPGFESAVVVLPRSDRSVPLLVATHGAGGDPGWECERWARVARERWFLLCPRGRALRRGVEGSYYYPDHLTLKREVTAAVRAAREAFGSRIAREHGVYLGYSQGATMGALMVVDHGAEFPHLVLIEGGSSDWTLKRAMRYRQTGGQSVYIGCGTSSCARHATKSVAALERAGLKAKTEHAEGGGHTELGPVGDLAERWLETLAVER
jgi:predicted esterase